MKKLISTHPFCQSAGRTVGYFCLRPIFSALVFGLLLFSSQITNAQISVTLNVTDISCNGNNDGSITAQGVGGWAPYTYTWSTGATGATISGLAAGTYSVTVQDIDLALAVGTAVVGQSCCINLFTTASFETCQGSNDATATVVASGGTQPYTYLWSDGQTTDIATGLSAGVYTVTVTDATGVFCSATQVVDLSPEGIWIMTSSTDAVCGQSNGTAHVGAMTGTPPYSYLWSNGNTTSDPTGLAAGTYTVTVSDSNGCSAVGTVVVNSSGVIPDPGFILTNDPTTFCVNDSIPDIVNVFIGGNPGPNYTFVVTDNAGNILIVSGTPTFDFTNAPPGVCRIYSIAWDGTITGLAVGNNLTDIMGCTALSQPISILREDCGGPMCNVTPGIISTNDPTTVCVSDGTPDLVDVTVSGSIGLFTAWIITDAAGNILALPAAPPFDFEGAGPGNCVIWHLTYDDPQPGLIVGNNINTDLVLCNRLSNPIEVVRNESPEVSINPLGAVICAGGTVQLIAVSASTGLAYQWTASGGSFDNPMIANPVYTMMMPGTYDISVTIMDVNGCTATASTTVTVNENPEVSITPQNGSVCAGEDLLLTANASGGNAPYTYSWTASGGNFSDPSSATPIYTMMMPGTYNVSVTVSDANGCEASATTTVTVNPNPTVSIDPDNASVCQGESIDLTAIVTGNGPFEYLWTATGGTFSDPFAANPSYTMMIPGTYDIFLVVTDANGCAASATTTITVNPNPTVRIEPDNASVCQGESIDFTAIVTGNGPFEYLWTATGGTFSDPFAANPSYTMMIPGTYDIFLVVTDTNGCAASATTTITVNPNPTVTINPGSTTVCQGESVDFMANVSGNGPFEYLWTATGGTFDDPFSANPTYTMMMPGTYDIFLVVTDINGCAASAVATVIVYQNPTVSIDPDDATTCAGQPLQLNANVSGGSAPYTYNWTASGGSFDDATIANPVYTMMMGGTFDISVTVVDTNGCQGSAMTTVTVEDPNAGTLTIDADPVCLQNGTATVSATPNGDAVVPAGYQIAYILTSEPGTVIRQISNSPSFTVTAVGDYTIHTLVYDPNTLDPSGINLGMTTAAEVNALLVQGGGDICAALDLTGASVNVFMRNIGDYVWIDINQNGSQDIFENGYEGATVTLLMAGADGLYCTADDIIVDQQTTDSDGLYLFECVLPGEYVVTFEINNPLYEFTVMDGITFDQFDSDADEMTGKTDPITINPGDGDDLTIDAGIHLICDNYTGGGIIEANQFGLCPGVVPQKLNSVALPSGGYGEIEYLWMYIELSNLTNPNPINWNPIPNSNSSMYQPPALFETTLFARCARAVDCDDYVESNILRIEVINCLGGAGNANISAQIMGNDDVKISWEVGPEHDFFNYYIERSDNGFDFVNIGKVEGIGNADGNNSYEFMDFKPLLGPNYYRIKQVGINNPVSYTPTVNVFIGMPGMFEIFAYPNPVKEMLHIEALKEVGDDAVLEVINTLGQVIAVQNLAKGETQIDLDFSSFVAGTYFVRIRSEKNDKVSIVKILKNE